MYKNSAEKLEVINQFKAKYPEWVNPELLSIKYCQNNAVAFLEMTFIKEPATPIIINLDFISDDSDQDTIEETPLLLKPEADVVDNAKTFVDFDTYSLINCVDGLFTKEAEEIINDSFMKANK